MNRGLGHQPTPPPKPRWQWAPGCSGVLVCWLLGAAVVLHHSPGWAALYLAGSVGVVAAGAVLVFVLTSKFPQPPRGA